MKPIRPSPNKEQWPRSETKQVECRKRDLVVRIANWLRDKDEPGYDVEVYIGGVYDWHESECFTIYTHKTARKCKALAVAFAQAKIAKLL